MSHDIAVIGGGMFGVTAAISLSDAGFEVTLYEKSSDILTGTSGSNHWRLHRGYHYPQSEATAKETLETEPQFRSRYEEAVITDENHYYAVAEESWVDYAEYEKFLNKFDLAYTEVNLDLVNDNRIEQTIRVDENHVSPDILREICWKEIDAAGVSVQLNTEIDSLSAVDSYDHKVIATYANSNSLLPESHNLRRQYKFEVCEVPVVELPGRYIGNNIIVVYGPFMSTDHWGDSDYFVMGDYHNMRHHTTVGFEPDIPVRYKELINSGIIEDPEVTNFGDFKSLGKKFIPGVGDSTHIGSMFTIRTILPDVEDTDARPTMIRQLEDTTVVFGGKLATSVQMAENVTEKVKQAVR